MTLQLSIPVDDEELIQIYETAPPEDREKIKTLLSLWLKQLKQDRKATLLAYMDTLSEKAQERGLTEDELKRILKDDE
ncbi:MAG: hypothetical protein L0154_15940 [Chloroflexi bacterium]|nr:hypothetical protein [Chloroflexota bacterium]